MSDKDFATRDDELRAKGKDLAAKGEAITAEEGAALMRITEELNQMDEIRQQARAAHPTESARVMYRVIKSTVIIELLPRDLASRLRPRGRG